jgi:hypothetical protein
MVWINTNMALNNDMMIYVINTKMMKVYKMKTPAFLTSVCANFHHLCRSMHAIIFII